MVIGDIDNDGRLTNHDVNLIVFSIADYDKLPEYYPQKPKLINKPKLDIQLSSDVDLSSYRWDIVNDLSKGSEVSAGDMFMVSVDVSKLGNLDVSSLNTRITLDSPYLSFVNRKDIFGGTRDEVMMISPRAGDGILPYWIDDYDDSKHKLWTNSTVNLGDILLITGESSNLRSYHITENGKYVMIPIKVDENAASGVDLGLSINGSDFIFKGYRDLTFFDAIEGTVKTHLIVK